MMNDLHPIPAKKTPIIQMQGICKQFQGVLANDRIDLDIYKAEIHALLGENGAGKSTLMKILYGFYKSDKGSIYLGGEEVHIKSPADSRKMNIGMVFQVLNLIPAMSVLENIALFLKDLPAVYDPSKLRDRIRAYSTQYDLEVNPEDVVSHLSIGEQQKVEILKLLLSDAQILILDEPTRVLAPHEVEGLFKVLNSLKQDGYAIVLITHKLREVLECADRITVLRYGYVAGTILQSDATEAGLIQLMFERQLTTQIVREEIHAANDPVLELVSFNTQGEGSGVSLKNVNIKVFPGEIVGVAGVSGNGQKELCDAVLGMEKIVSGKKLLQGKDFTHSSTGKIRKFGLGFIPENPLTMATVPFMSVMENMAITRSPDYARYGGLTMDWKLVKEDTQKSLEKFGFTFSHYTPAKSLSGGNLQRLIIAREMMKEPKLIVASYLTRGLDVQSTLVARQELMQARNQGAGVLLISEDLEELFSLSDRLIVLFEGEIVGEFKPEATDHYEIGYLMTGSKEPHEFKR
jgi:general nucleoside transport system ATP-binding protein